MWCFFLVLILPWRWLAWRGKPRLWQKDRETRFANSVTGDVVRASALDCRVFHLISDQHRKDRLFVTPRLQSSVNWERGVTCLTRGHCGRRLWFVATRHLFSGSSLSAAIVAAFLLPCETFGCGDSSCVTSVTCHVARALSLPACWHLQTSHSSRHETKRQTGEETKASKHSEYESICRTLLTFRLTVQISTIQRSPCSFCRSPNSQRPAADGGRQIHKTHTRVRFSKTKIITNPNKVQKPSNGSPVSTEQLWRVLKDVPNLSCKLVSAEPVEIVNHTKQVQTHLWCKHNTRFRVTSRNKQNRLNPGWRKLVPKLLCKGCTWNCL